MSIFRNSLSLILFVLICFYFSAQNEVSIYGYAPSYVGKTIYFNQIDDYISANESILASTVVKPDSTFLISLNVEETQRISINANNNFSHLYVQPGGEYQLYIPGRDPYQPYKETGNNIEVTFFDLDSADINYKILSFQLWCDEFMGSYFHMKNIKPDEFDTELKRFRLAVENYYSKDTSVYLKAHVMYTMAMYDNVQYTKDHSTDEKYMFYLHSNPVYYNNDAYMEYFNSFYDRVIPRLDYETDEKVYQAVLQSSPSLIMRALNGSFILKNLRIRELVMLKALGEEFYSKEFPQTNIITILDSVSKGSMFPEHALIARNLINRLTQLVTGGLAPDFFIKNAKGELFSLSSFNKKHLYIHFYDPSMLKSTLDVEALKKLYTEYKGDVEFISIYPNKSYTEDEITNYVLGIPWNTFKLDLTNPIWADYNAVAFPYYVLLDRYGYVVAAPARGPMPDGQYLSIDETFFNIHKINSNK